ncbi:hypothetical protein SEVIR_2G389950v4 [Setaria viridis]
MGLPSCPVVEINSCIGNLTSSYTEKSNEPSMVAASVIMFVLAGLFFNLNLFSGISDISAILDPQSPPLPHLGALPLPPRHFLPLQFNSICF